MLTRHVEEPWQSGTTADEHAQEARIAQLLERRRLADHEVGDEPPAEAADLRHDVVDQLVRQTELGDAVPQHPAELVERLEHGDREALGGEQVGRDQARRTRAHDRHRRPYSLLPRIVQALEPRGKADRVGELLPLGQEPLELADAHRLLVDAHALALQLLRAHAAGDVRQRVARLQHLERLAEPAFADQLEHRRDVDLYGAAALGLDMARDEHAQLARRLGALLVTQRLQPHDELDVAAREAEVHVAEEALVDELEVLGPCVRVTDVRLDRVAGRPVLAEPGEHRVLPRQVSVQCPYEHALLAQRQLPEEAHHDAAGVVVTAQHIPDLPDEVVAQLRLTELPGHGLHAVGGEQVPERAGIGGQTALQQTELVGVPGRVHWMISASQVAFTREMRAARSSVMTSPSRASGINRPTVRGSSSTTMVAFSNSDGSSW